MSPAKGKKKGSRSIFSPQAMQAFGTDYPFRSSNVTPQSNFGATLTPTAKAFSPAQAPQATPKIGSGALCGSSNSMPLPNFGVTSTPASSALTTSPFAKAETVPDPRLPASRDVDTSGSIVMCRVGNPPQTFSIHRAVLYKSSEFLKTYAEHNGADYEPTISLPDQDAEGFMVYSKWLYTSAIISLPHDDSGPTISKDTAEWIDLAKAYAVGEKLIDIDFKDTVIDALRAKVKGLGGATVWDAASEVVRIIYKGTPKASPARRFVVDLYHGGASNLKEEDKLPSDFLFDLARVGLSRMVKMQVSSVRCEYHQHGADKACYIDRKA